MIGPPATATADLGSVLALLRLLAAEAPLSVLHEFIELRCSGRDERASGEWRQIGGVVTRLWEVLSERKHRQHEILALFETASDLTSSLQDTDELLDRIVQRARQRFGSDACYLVLNHPESGEARMRVTAGSAGSAIGSAHLPASWGLVGVMKESGRPYFSTNYLSDPNIMHDPGVDAAATDEGIVSLAGAPLKLGEEMLGALFVAHRHERAFSDAELNLLGSLANHAAIVLQKARLFEAMRTALEELQRANAEVENHVRALERASTIHEQLTRLVLVGADLYELARTVAEVLGGELLVVDSALQVRAASTPDAMIQILTEAGLDPARLMADLREADTAAAELLDDEVSTSGGRSIWVAPVRAGVETLGALVLATRAGLGGADIRTLERSAQTAAVLILIERTLALAEEQVRGEFVDELFADRAPDWASIERRARRVGVDTSQPHVVLVASTESDHRRRLCEIAHVFARERAGIAGERAGQVVMVVGLDEAGEAARFASAELTRAVRAPVTVGSAGPAETLEELREAHRDATQCHDVLLTLDRAGQGACLATLGMFGVLLETSTDERLRSFVGRSLGPVAAYDRENGTALLDTLDAYFGSRANPRLAAKELHVHTNTVYQRLERIESLLAPADWRAPDVALELQLALKLRRILAHGRDAMR